VETLVRLFLLGCTEPEPAATAALGPLPLPAALAGGLVERDGAGIRAALDVRPYGEGDPDGASWWVVSDLGSDVRPGPVRGDHVLGVGAASVTLARATVRRPVGTALDLGTGCGVQALHLSRHAGAVTGTDLLPRALRLAGMTARLNGLSWELLPGDLLDPVAGRRFDLVVSNPPFVVGPGDGGFAYRDSGLAGDEVCRRLVRAAPGVLADGGWCQLLANWAHVEGEPWQERLAGWLDGLGCDAWVWQREVADPAQYAALWLADAGERGSAGYEQRYARWLDWFTATRVEAVGFGLVTLRRAGSADPVVRIEDVPQPVQEPAGPHVGAWFDRQDALRAAVAAPAGLAAARLRHAPGLVLEQLAEPGPEGWAVTEQRLRQTGGLRRSAEVDEVVAALVAGCDGTRTLAELGAVLDLAYGVDEAQLAPMATALVDQGFLIL
jgi:methylase of polypeptide subunit release factors